MRNEMIGLLNKQDAIFEIKKEVQVHRARTGMDYKLADILTVDDLKRVRDLTGKDIMFLMDEGYTDGQIVKVIKEYGRRKNRTFMVSDEMMVGIMDKGASPELIKAIKNKNRQELIAVYAIITVVTMVFFGVTIGVMGGVCKLVSLL